VAKQLPPIPREEEAESHTAINQAVRICPIHTRQTWREHARYEVQADGTVTCQLCPWGTLLPGYLRVQSGKIIDLRDAAGE